MSNMWAQHLPLFSSDAPSVLLPFSSALRRLFVPVLFHHGYVFLVRYLVDNDATES